MAQATSGEQPITIDGQKYKVRTQVVYQDGLGVPGTLSTTAPIRYVVQYLPGPSPLNPIPVWTNLGERDITNKNNWIFTPAAGTGFQKALIANGPNSLTNSLDKATTNALSKSSGVTQQQAKQILQVAPNAAPVGAAPVQPTPAAAAAPGSNNPTVTGFNTATNAGLNLNITYKYPLNMDVKQDCIKFEIFRLNRTTGQTFQKNIESNILRKQTKFGRSGEEDFYTRIGGPIYMGIQGPIVDQNIADWGSGQLNELQRILVEKSAGAMVSQGDPAKAFSDLITGLMGEVKKNDVQLKGILYSALLEQAVGVSGLLPRITGGVLNPNMELLFQGPQLRPFNFTFKMSPREKPEADVVKAIIKAFKRNMAPKVNGLFLQSPHVFKITYMHGEKDEHKSLNLIKMCALQNCSIDYTPLGTYMTYNDDEKLGGDPEASMVSYTMNLTFSEITPIYQDDYDATDTKDHPIGF